MYVNMSNIHWYIIKNLHILAEIVVVDYYVPGTVVCMTDVAANKTGNAPSHMVFVSQSDNETTSKKAEVNSRWWYERSKAGDGT